MSMAAADGNDAIAELFRVLGHSVRMAILRQLSAGERSVGDIASATGTVMSTLSQQLAMLRKAELVTTRRDAKQIFYALNPTCFAQLRTAIAALCPDADTLNRAELPPHPGRVGAAMFARVERRG